MPFLTHAVLIFISFIIAFLVLGFLMVKFVQSEKCMAKNDCWQIVDFMDLKPGLFNNAIMATFGIFNLKKDEILYLIAEQDSSGIPLKASNTYCLKGNIPDSRYWSICIYGSKRALIANKDKIYGYNSQTIKYATNSIAETSTKTIEINFGSNIEGKLNPLSGGTENRLFIMLRLYQARPSYLKQIKMAELPSIIKI